MIDSRLRYLDTSEAFSSVSPVEDVVTMNRWRIVDSNAR